MAGSLPTSAQTREASTLMDEDPREWAEVESISSETDYALSGPHADRDDTLAATTGVLSGRSGTASSRSTVSATRERRNEGFAPL